MATKKDTNAENPLNQSSSGIPQRLGKQPNPLPHLSKQPSQRPVKRAASDPDVSTPFKKPRASISRGSELASTQELDLEEIDEGDATSSQEQESEEETLEEEVRSAIVREVRHWIALHGDSIMKIETKKHLVKRDQAVRARITNSANKK